MRLPDFVIIGAMKCGTSSLHEQLALRPGIFMSRPKEPNFFSDDENFERGPQWYAGLFREAGPAQICGESSTHYTKLPTYPRTVERMRVQLPDVRLVYLMRDPIARISSQYVHEWSQGEVREPFERAVERHERYRAYSCYAYQLEPFLRAFGPDRVLPVFFERLLVAPSEELGRICRFVGDPHSGDAAWRRDLPPQNVSAERLRRSAIRDALLRMPGSAALRTRLPRAWRERAKGLWRMQQRPVLPEPLRRRLETHIDVDLARLGRWLGAHLDCRSFGQQVAAAALEWKEPPA